MRLQVLGKALQGCGLPVQGCGTGLQGVGMLLQGRRKVLQAVRASLQGRGLSLLPLLLLQFNANIIELRLGRAYNPRHLLTGLPSLASSQA